MKRIENWLNSRSLGAVISGTQTDWRPVAVSEERVSRGQIQALLCGAK